MSAISTLSPLLSSLVSRIPELSVCSEALAKATATIEKSYLQGGKLLLCGNGGSASDCEHIAGELLKGFMQKRPLSPPERSALPETLAKKLQGGLPAIPLCGFPGLSTAFINDVDPQLVFAQLVVALGKPGDILLGISTSGNAANVAAAMETASARGLRTIGLTGRSGGRLAQLTEICIRVPADETYRVQEYHLPVYHCLCQILEERFYPEKPELL